MFTRNGLTSTVLVEKGIVATTLTVTWVEVDVGGARSATPTNRSRLRDHQRTRPDARR